MEKLWGILVQLSMHFGYDRYDTLPFDDSLWDYILENAAKTGVNTVILDLCDGIQYATHPEISMNGAWSRKRVRQEVKRCADMGITLIPKLNFSTTHRNWLGPYANMISTPEYYRVCADLIREVYELFDRPRYIHLGMDEENDYIGQFFDLVVYRKGKLFWHDLRFLMDCVQDVGAKPWIWADSLFEHTEEFMANVDPDEVLISPWYYNAFRPESYTPIETIDKDGKYAAQGLKFIEDLPDQVHIRKVAAELMHKGFVYAPTGSVFGGIKRNMPELVEYFENAKPCDGQIAGYITAPWKAVQWENREFFDESFRTLRLGMEEAKKGK